MPLWTPTNSFPGTVDTAVRGGVNITSSASIDTKGAWTSIVTATAKDSYGFFTSVGGLHQAATVTNGLLDVGIGPTDPPEIIVPDWLIGTCETNGTNGCGDSKQQFWPIFIPSGSKIWARTATIQASRVMTFKIFCLCDMPYGFTELYEKATAYGVTVTGSKGVNATSGTGVYGAQVQLTAATSRDHYAWAIGLGQGSDTTLTQNSVWAQLLIGSGATGPIGPWTFQMSTNEIIGGPLPPWPIQQFVASGTRIDCRVQAGAATDSYDAIAYGLG